DGWIMHPRTATRSASERVSASAPSLALRDSICSRRANLSSANAPRSGMIHAVRLYSIRLLEKSSGGFAMKVEQILGQHVIKENPFGQEDAQSDQVFKRHCLEGTHHPAWDKVFGSPEEPATAVVFGEKGSGKTALRLQIVDQIARYNREHPDRRVLVVEYDDFNPFLDAFRDRLFGGKRRADRSLESWRLWDHMDAILTLGVTRLVDKVLSAGTAAAGAEAISLEQLDALPRLE